MHTKVGTLGLAGLLALVGCASMQAPAPPPANMIELVTRTKAILENGLLVSDSVWNENDLKNMFGAGKVVAAENEFYLRGFFPATTDAKRPQETIIHVSKIIKNGHVAGVIGSIFSGTEADPPTCMDVTQVLGRGWHEDVVAERQVFRAITMEAFNPAPAGPPLIVYYNLDKSRAGWSGRFTLDFGLGTTLSRVDFRDAREPLSETEDSLASRIFLQAGSAMQVCWPP